MKTVVLIILAIVLITGCGGPAPAAAAKPAPDTAKDQPAEAHAAEEAEAAAEETADEPKKTAGEEAVVEEAEPAAEEAAAEMKTVVPEPAAVPAPEVAVIKLINGLSYQGIVRDSFSTYLVIETEFGVCEVQRSRIRSESKQPVVKALLKK